jgi:hypothetical protein
VVAGATFFLEMRADEVGRLVEVRALPAKEQQGYTLVAAGRCLQLAAERMLGRMSVRC